MCRTADVARLAPAKSSAFLLSREGCSHNSGARRARLSRKVRQPNYVLGNSIADHKAERRPGAGEERLATTEHDRVEVDSILVNKTKVGQATCQDWSGNFNFPA